ncbi:MAG: DUF4249 family protein [Cyclobacteriaceae bacterium]|nr:DUF4249 family protein [Cyclobacteriaceae bacterium]
MKIYIYIFYFFFGLSLAACVEPYNFKSEARESFLVVDGRITQLEKYNTLRLTRSTPYGQAADLIPVDNGLVKIYKNDEEGIECKKLGDGFYQLATLGEVGNSYFIEITIGDKI